MYLMNNAMNLTAPTTEPSTIKAGKSVTYRNVQPGQHAQVEPKSRIVLWGTQRRLRPYQKGVFLTPYRIEFRVGDWAEYDSYNLSYTGRIVAIGAKTVTIESYPGTANARKHRLSIYKFNWRNWNFDAELIARRNSEWMD